MKKKAPRQINQFGKFQFQARFFYDSIAILLAWFVSYYVRFFLLGGERDSVQLFLLLGIFAWFSGIFFIYSSHLYEARITSHWRKEVYRLFMVSIYEFLAFVVLYYYVFYYKISRLHLLMFWAFLLVFLVLGRFCVNKLSAKLISTGQFKNNLLFVGNGERLCDYRDAVVSSGETSRLKMCGHYLGGELKLDGVKSISAATLEEAVKKTSADIVVVSFRDCDNETENDIINQSLEFLNQRVFLLPSVPKTHVGINFGDFHYIPTLELNRFTMTTGKRFIKRLFDLVACSLAVIILSPLFLLLALLVKLSSPGPVFYRQKRVTVDGKIFTMLKFRSMRTNMKEEGGAHWTEENDPRITPIGKLLRKTSLDEIPQFLNVIQGSMSLIGPRPERPELEKKFLREIPGYNMRHRMKAGISGWAQVNGLRGNTSLEKRVEYDLYYIRNWSFFLDMKIVVLTFFKGFVNKNAY